MRKILLSRVLSFRQKTADEIPVSLEGGGVRFRTSFIGAGKSTLLKILLGLLPPSSGGGRLLGHEISQSDGPALRRLVGYTSEAAALIPGLPGAESVALAGELYGMPRRESQRRAQETLTYL